MRLGLMCLGLSVAAAAYPPRRVPAPSPFGKTIHDLHRRTSSLPHPRRTPVPALLQHGAGQPTRNPVGRDGGIAGLCVLYSCGTRT